MGGKIIAQETSARGEVSLCRDTVDASLLPILEASVAVLLSINQRELRQRSEASLMRRDRC